MIRNIFIYFLPVFLLPACTGDNQFSCMYQPVQNEKFPQPELTSFDSCGTVSDSGKLIFDDEHLNQIEYGGKGNLACIYTRSKNRMAVFYMKSNGDHIETVYLDNGCDYFESGLARTRIDGKLAYFDRDLKIILTTEYESASPFYQRIASTCRGGEYVQHGEHSILQNAECAYFGLDGKVLVDFMPQDKLPHRETIISGSR